MKTAASNHVDRSIRSTRNSSLAGERRSKRLFAPGSSFVALALGVGVFAWVGTVHASSDYPAVIRDSLGMECTPQCIICHKDNGGGPGNLRNTGFVRAMADQGVFGRTPERIPQALQAIENTMPEIDSDGDGLGDIQELRVSRNPSEPDTTNDEGDVCSNEVRYGCGARMEPRSPLDGTAGLLAGLAALGLGYLTRRRWASRA